MAATIAATKNRAAGFRFTITSQTSREKSNGLRKAHVSYPGIASAMPEVTPFSIAPLAGCSCDSDSFRSPLKRKPVQEREIARDDGEASQHQQSAQDDQQSAAGHFERMHVRAEAAVKLEKALDAERSQQK